MIVYAESQEEIPTVGRHHPWKGPPSNPEIRYYDFKEHPESIREVLEDFKPHDKYPAVQRFYDLIEWLNGPASALETNDCAFRGPYPNQSDWASFPKILECSGRLMVFQRILENNCDERYMDRWGSMVYEEVESVDQTFRLGAVGLALYCAQFMALEEGTQIGSVVNVKFWSWGDDEEEMMANLDRTVMNLDTALKRVSSQTTSVPRSTIPSLIAQAR